MLDVHAHILPGVDDGSRSPSETMRMLAAAKLAGVDTICATPHLRTLERDMDHIRRVYGGAREAAARHDIRLYQGFEVDYRVLPQLDFTSELARSLCICGTNFMLLELPVSPKPVRLEVAVSGLIQAGIEVIIAHPERYEYVQEDPRFVLEMANYGCRIQVDVDSLYRSRFSGCRRAALKILKSGWADCVASDAHRPDDYKMLRDALKDYEAVIPTKPILEWPSDEKATPAD